MHPGRPVHRCEPSTAWIDPNLKGGFMDENLKSKFKLPYEPPQIFDLWTSTAHAADSQCHKGSKVVTPRCATGGSPGEQCSSGGTAYGGTCQSGSVATGTCDAGSSAQSGQCKSGSVPVGDCKAGSAATGKCSKGSAPVK